MLYVYDDFQSAFIGQLRTLLSFGKEVTVRGSTTKELLMNSFIVNKPMHRISIVNGRNNNIFAQIAETVWMLAGRDDLDFLEKYIPSVRKWSDDGETWRGAYGPRLRKWDAGYFPVDDNPTSFSRQYKEEVDQFKKVARKINDDKFTRQAVMTLWDPAHDWVIVSKDYPCNNWLHFIQRDGMLHLNVAVRSNDVIYGFSHVDFFGWSVLLQAMAYWTKLEVGTINWNATSFHLYDTHWDKAREMVAYQPIDVYDSRYSPYIYKPPVWNTPLTLMDSEELPYLFEVADGNIGYLNDAYRKTGFLHECTVMMALYNTYLSKDTELAYEYFSILPYTSDFRAAALEFFLRKWPDLLEVTYDDLTGSDKKLIASIESFYGNL